jgi:predicted metal-dependent HD superfamily phosphohydrolase
MDTSTQHAMSVQYKQLLRPYTDSDTSQMLFDNLIRLYGEPHRSYHNLQHIANLFDLATRMGLKFSDPETVHWAIWYHDAIYDTKKKNNEQLSADLATQTMSLFGQGLEHKTSAVAQLILSTLTHFPIGDAPDCPMFLDLDLSVFGASPEIYEQYSRGIRHEYNYVPDFIYKQARKSVLQKFVGRRPLYFTEPFRDMFEAQARENLKREIAQL